MFFFALITTPYLHRIDAFIVICTFLSSLARAPARAGAHVVYEKSAGEPTGTTNYPLSRNIMNYRFRRRSVAGFINCDRPYIHMYKLQYHRVYIYIRVCVCVCVYIYTYIK